MVGDPGNEAGIRLELGTNAAVLHLATHGRRYGYYQVWLQITMVYHEAAVSHTEQSVQPQDRASPRTIDEHP